MNGVFKMANEKFTIVKDRKSADVTIKKDKRSMLKIIKKAWVDQ